MHKTVTLGCKLWPRKQRLQTLYVDVVWNGVVFPHIYYILFHMLDTFYLSLKFFLKYYFNILCFQLPQKCNVISSSTGINGVRLAHHISLEASMTGGHIVSHCSATFNQLICQYRHSIKLLLMSTIASLYLRKYVDWRTSRNEWNQLNYNGRQKCGDTW